MLELLYPKKHLLFSLSVHLVSPNLKGGGSSHRRICSEHMKSKGDWTLIHLQ